MNNFDPKTFDPKAFDPTTVWGNDPLAMESVAQGQEEIQRNSIPFESLSPKYRNLNRFFLAGSNIALLGDAQNGKTTTAKQLCGRNKWAYEEVPCSTSTKKSDLVGKVVINPKTGLPEFQLGPLGRCWTQGKCLILNEGMTMTADQTTPMLGYFDGTKVISEGDIILHRHPMFRVIATGNPLYIGSKPQNPAFMSRFGVKIRTGRWPESVFVMVALSKWANIKPKMFSEADTMCRAVEQYAAENGGVISVGIREVTDLMNTLLLDDNIMPLSDFKDLILETIVGGLADQKISNDLVDAFLETDIQKARVELMHQLYTQSINPNAAPTPQPQKATGLHGQNAFDSIYMRKGMK